MRSVVIYYSRSGNTKDIAEKISQKFDSDMFFVGPDREYGSYISSVMRVAKEKLLREDITFRSDVTDLSSYDVVFIGFPVWYGNIPHHLKEYLLQTDLKGKHVIPFITAGANGKENCLNTIKDLCPHSEITDHFFTSMMSKADVSAWLDKIYDRYDSCKM